jgi:arylsulfatase A-like enzyme
LRKVINILEVDVAPTIAALLGMTPPGSAQGSPLAEVSQ